MSIHKVDAHIFPPPKGWLQILPQSITLSNHYTFTSNRLNRPHPHAPLVPLVTVALGLYVAEVDGDHPPLKRRFVLQRAALGQDGRLGEGCALV